MYTREIAEQITAALADGRTLRSICRQPGMPPHPTVLRWVHQDVDGFAAKYREARDIGYEVMVDQVLDYADESGTETGEVQKARLQVDARKWALAKALPKIYGDRVTLAGERENPLIIEDNRVPIEQFIAEFRRDPGYEASARGPEAPEAPSSRPKAPPSSVANEPERRRGKPPAAGFEADEPEPPPRRSAPVAVDPDPLARFRGSGVNDWPPPPDDR